MGELPRAFVKIQKLRRIVIPEHLMDMLGWKIGDQILIEAYKGKLIVEPLNKAIKPQQERYK